MVTTNLKNRIAVLEQRIKAKTQGSFAERLKAARERLHAMTPDEREANRVERLRRWLAKPEPMVGGMMNRLWHAAQREAHRQGPLQEKSEGAA